MGKAATSQRVLLEPAHLVRYSRELTVEELTEFRRSIGLDQPDQAASPGVREITESPR